MNKSPIALAISSLCFALAVASAQTPTPGATLTSSPVFEKNCSKCYGKTAEGRHFGGPALISAKAKSPPPMAAHHHQQRKKPHA